MLLLHGCHVSILISVPSGCPLPQEDGGVSAVPLAPTILCPRLAQALLMQAPITTLVLQDRDCSACGFLVHTGLGTCHRALCRVWTTISITKLVLRQRVGCGYRQEKKDIPDITEKKVALILFNLYDSENFNAHFVDSVQLFSDQRSKRK